MDKSDWIQIGAAAATFFAAFVALFKDWIYSIWYKVNYEFVLQNDGLYEDVVNNEAIRYYTNLEVKNTGNLFAEECSLYLECACFYINDNENPEKEIRRQLNSIKWDDLNNVTNIPPGGHRVIELYKLIAPVSLGSPSTNTDSLVSKCSFAGITEIDAKKGKWEVTYSVNSKNATVKRFMIIVAWDGEWKPRLSDIRSRLTVKLKML